jgi:signal transduction histidine kinase
MSTQELQQPVPSMRRRLLNSMLIIVLAACAVGAVVAAWSTRLVVSDLMRSGLEETAQSLVVLAEHETDIEALSHDRVLPAAPHREAILWQLRASDGSIVARSHQAPSAPWDVPLAEGYLETAELAVFTVSGERLWLQAAQPLSSLHAAQRKIALLVTGVVLTTGAVLAFIMWRVMQAELRPLGRMASDVDAIELTMAPAALPRSPRSELEPVYSALDKLQRRVTQQLRSEHAFASHAAHSLRTPLAGLSAQVEVARLQAPAELKPRLALALDATRRLDGVVGGLLAMSRTHGPVAWQTFAACELGRVALGRRIAVDVSALESAPALSGNLDLLAAAVANLVDNASRHGASTVSLDCPSSASLQAVRVQDDGPGVQRSQLDVLRQGLRRFSETGEIASNVGLGLTLAAAVARAHAGEVNLDCNVGRQSGFCVRISWPRQQA